MCVFFAVGGTSVTLTWSVIKNAVLDVEPHWSKQTLSLYQSSLLVLASQSLSSVRPLFLQKQPLYSLWCRDPENLSDSLAAHYPLLKNLYRRLDWLVYVTATRQRKKEQQQCEHHPTQFKKLLWCVWGMSNASVGLVGHQWWNTSSPALYSEEHGYLEQNTFLILRMFWVCG